MPRGRRDADIIHHLESIYEACSTGLRPSVRADQIMVAFATLDRAWLPDEAFELGARRLWGGLDRNRQQAVLWHVAGADPFG